MNFYLDFTTQNTAPYSKTESTQLLTQPHNIHLVWAYHKTEKPINARALKIAYKKCVNDRMPKIAVNDIEINYQEEGEGFPLVLIHGLFEDSTTWGLVMPEFSKKYRTITLDIRGHGHSGKPDMPYSIQLFSEDLFEFLQKLGIAQVHLLGVSMGGAIAQQFALDHPEMIRSLVLVSTFSYNDPDLHKTFSRLRRCMADGGNPAFFDEAVKLVFTPYFVSANAKAIAEWRDERNKINSPTAIVHAIDACMAFNVKDRISQISHPTLIISGREDVLTPIRLSEQIHRSVRGSERKIMESVGHNLHIEKAPELVQMTLDFLL